MNGKSIVLLLLLSILSACSDTNPPSLGVHDSRLTPCPDRPNCVSSQSTDTTHTIVPLTQGPAASTTIADLKMLVGSMKGVTVVSESPVYLRVEFKSDVFRFIDDVEFVIDHAAKVVHVRSASRIGYYDFGTNRRRVEKIRKTWSQRKNGYKPGSHIDF